MPQRKADKIFFEFTGGINTDVSPLSFPDGVSLDEENFELMPDGSRRRRRGLRLEDGGVQLDAPALDLDNASAFASYRWLNVSGDSELQFIVIQVGRFLYFFEDSETLSSNQVGDPIDLNEFNTTDNDTNINKYAVTFADNTGVLYVSAPKIQPVSIEWDVDASQFNVTSVPLKIRDFKGIDDGIPLTTQPTSLSNAHYYNLKNRGWKDVDITQYFSDKAKYPAKNMVPWKGYRRLIDTAYAEEDGEKEWNSTKLEQEVFGNSSAPQGSLFLDPFDTIHSADDDAVGAVPIVTWSKAVFDLETWTVTIEATGHGLAPGDDVIISGNQFEHTNTHLQVVTNSLNGTYNVETTPDANHLTILYTHSPLFGAFTDQYKLLGYLDEQGLVNSDGLTTVQRPRAVAGFASRIFWAGTDHPAYSDIIFFSQIITKTTQRGRCCSENDPTGEHLNELLPSDGGTIQVPGMGGVLKMVPFGSGLYVFSTQGVWEIGPGQAGFFSATGYSVRKVSEVEASSVLGVVAGDFGIVFTSPRGIFVLVQDPNSGFVTAQSLSEGRLQTLWNAVPVSKQIRTQCVFDSARKRYYILYTLNAGAPPFLFDRALVFDGTRQAWYRMKFPGTTADHIIGAVTISGADESDGSQKLKMFARRDTDQGLDIMDFNHDDFEDFDGDEMIPYLLTGYDNVGDFQRRRQAPICHVFMNRTETGYTAVGDEMIPVNEGSIFLEARWDWANRDITGKFSDPQQVYRHVRAFHPTAVDDLDGYPVVVTRNKLRGRGRALHLKFYGEEGKDAHLLGWALQYAGSVRE